MCSDFFVEARSKSLLQHGRQGVMWTGRAEDLSSERRCSNIRVQTGGGCSRGSDDVRHRRRSGTRGRLLLQRLVSVNGRRLRAGRAGRCVGVVGVAMELVLRRGRHVRQQSKVFAPASSQQKHAKRGGFSGGDLGSLRAGGLRRSVDFGAIRDN